MPNERETTASNHLLFHWACVSSSRPTWCIWCQVHLSIFFCWKCFVTKESKCYLMKHAYKRTIQFSLYFYYLPLIILRKWLRCFNGKKCYFSSGLLFLPTLISAFYHCTKKPTKCFKGGVFLAFASCLNTERSYKRQGHDPSKHFVGFLAQWWKASQNNGRSFGEIAFFCVKPTESFM